MSLGQSKHILLAIFLIILAFPTGGLGQGPSGGHDEPPDAKKLAEISLHDSDPKARMTAVEQLSDQGILAEVARNDSNARVRWTAVDKLTDQHTLAHVARYDTYDLCRFLALQRITDDNTLAELARLPFDSDLNSKVALKALERLKDQNVLANLAKVKTVGDLKRAEDALRRITNSKALIDLAQDPMYPLRNKAAARLLNLQGTTLPEDNWEHAAEIQLVLLDPVIVKYFGNLFLDYKPSYTKHHYKVDPGYQTMLGWEAIDVSIKDSKGMVLARRQFKGRTPEQTEEFPTHAGVALGKTLQASVKIDQVCLELLQNLDKEGLQEIAKRAQDYRVRKVASSLMQP